MLFELEALGRRAVACKGWRWLPGMLRRFRAVACRVTEDNLQAGVVFSAESVPDLSDPATLGGLLALVREAWSEPLGSVYYLVTMVEDPGWYAELGDSEELYDTEAEALVAALEAADAA